MKKQVYQIPELRDASNSIIQAGTYGRTSPLVNADNTGVLDYINNNLEALHDAQQTGNGVRAAADSKGQLIDIAALKKLITDTVTQAKKDAILAAHPVGSYYISDKATDPGTLFGGTWKMLDPGLTLISQGKGTDKFGSFEFVAGQTYGERLHQLTVEESAKHKHFVSALKTGSGLSHSDPKDDRIKFESATACADKYETADNPPCWNWWGTTCSAGKDRPHNTMQPSMAAYIWHRIS